MVLEKYSKAEINKMQHLCITVLNWKFFEVTKNHIYF